jgi:hypothetical protein
MSFSATVDLPGGADEAGERVLEVLVVEAGELRVLLDDLVDLLGVRAVADPERLQLRLQRASGCSRTRSRRPTDS